VPKQLPLGPLMDYGYEGEVVFPILLHGADSLKVGTSLDACGEGELAGVPRELHSG
jgi:DsbC/DsbD-like thiol-disulfide interchange protein